MLYECVQLIISLKKMIEKLKMIIPSDFENNFSIWNSVNIFSIIIIIMATWSSSEKLHNWAGKVLVNVGFFEK